MRTVTVLLLSTAGLLASKCLAVTSCAALMLPGFEHSAFGQELVYPAAFARARALGAPLENARGFAWAHAPEDSFRRAQLLSQRTALTPRFPEVVAINGKGQIEYGRTRFKRLAVNSWGNSLRYFTPYVEPKDADAIFVAFHGQGAAFSHSGGLLSLLDAFIPTARSSGFRFELEAALRAKGVVRGDGALPRIYAEAIDQPFHGAGPDDPTFFSLTVVAELFRYRLEQLKAFGKPIIVLGRSGASTFLFEIQRRWPGLIDSLILVSPDFPEPSVAKELDRRMALVYPAIAPEFRLSWRAWVAVTRWEQHAKQLWVDDGKTLAEFAASPHSRVFLGGADKYIIEEEFELWTRHAGNRIRVIPNAEHNTMEFTTLEQKQRTIEQLVDIYGIAHALAH